MKEWKRGGKRERERGSVCICVSEKMERQAISFTWGKKKKKKGEEEEKKKMLCIARTWVILFFFFNIYIRLILRESRGSGRKKKEKKKKRREKIVLVLLHIFLFFFRCIDIQVNSKSLFIISPDGWKRKCEENYNYIIVSCSNIVIYLLDQRMLDLKHGKLIFLKCPV